MKKHIFASALFALVTAAMASACDDGGHRYGRRGPSESFGCGQYASCGACTPVDGCGWCQTGVGQGMCADDPNECAGAAAFSWTWDPSGCFAGADASVSPPPASTPEAPDGAAGSASPSDGGTGFVRTSDDSGITGFDAELPR
jgi:hypothetical protein